MHHTISIRRVMPAVALVVALFAGRPAVAQVSISVGPHVSTLGVGLSGEVRLLRLVGVSAEYNFAPLSTFEREGFSNRFVVEPTLGGGMILVMLHPGGGKFAIGGGLMQGGLAADGTISLDSGSGATFDINGSSYSAAQVGSLIGEFEYGSTQPAFALGVTGRGFNLLLGAALATPELDARATGPIASDPSFRADLDAELQDARDDLEQIPVYPYVRLGWHFGF